jgi:lipopolysaccharide export system protein LptC
MATRLLPRFRPAPTVGDHRGAAIARWKRRSHVVHFFRRALPLAIAAIAALVLGWIVVRSIIGNLTADQRQVASIHLTRAKYYGRNNKGQAFVLASDEAVRDGADPDRIHLAGPHLRLENGAALPLTVQSARGVFSEKSKILDLDGRVHLDNGAGYIFDSAHARVDTQTNEVTGQTTVTGSGPLGQISADTYAIYDKGDRVVFRGNVRCQIIPHPPQPAARR